MGKVYAKNEKTGDRSLVWITCECCDSIIMPSKDIENSGWKKYVRMEWVIGRGNDTFEYHYCPKCSHKVP